MRKIIHAKVLKDYTLLLTFDNQECRLFDMSKELTGVFEYLKDYDHFTSFELVSGTLTWFRKMDLDSNLCNELDVCPDYAYMESIPYEVNS